MTLINLKEKINIKQINKKIYHFKSKKEFDNEFDFNDGIYLGKGNFGEVRSCKSKFDFKDKDKK